MGERHFHFGLNGLLTISGALERLAAAERLNRYALISTIDSTRPVRGLISVPRIVQEAGLFYAEADDDIVVETASFMTLAEEENLLTGFDEIWLLDKVPTEGKPDGLFITSDLPLEGEPPGGLEDWMRDSDVQVGLGDGDGLNFATFDEAIAGLLRD